MNLPEIPDAASVRNAARDPREAAALHEALATMEQQIAAMRAWLERGELIRAALREGLQGTTH